MNAERRVRVVSFAASAALHLALFALLRGAATDLHIVQPAPILVTLYDVGRSAAGPGPLGPELAVDPLRSAHPGPPTDFVITPPPRPAAFVAIEPPRATPARQAKRPEPTRDTSVPQALKPESALPNERVDPSDSVRRRTRAPEPESAANRAPAFESASVSEHEQGVGLASAVGGESGTGAELRGPPGGAAGGTGASAPAYAARIRIAYEQQIFLWLERFKLYPQLAQRRRLEGTSTLRVRIDRRGKVLASSLQRPTGERLLDDAALGMVARADPFPPIPDGYPDDTFEFLAPVEFRLR